MKIFKRYLPYLLIVLVFSILGMMCSFVAQPGGINKVNGFLAPMIGPWSRFLNPNGAYTLKMFDLYAAIATVIMLAAMYFSPRVKNKPIRIIAVLTTCLLVTFWCFIGLGKAICETR